MVRYPYIVLESVADQVKALEGVWALGWKRNASSVTDVADRWMTLRERQTGMSSLPVLLVDGMRPFDIGAGMAAPSGYVCTNSIRHFIAYCRTLRAAHEAAQPS